MTTIPNPDPLDLVDPGHTHRSVILASTLADALADVLNARNKYEDASTKALDAERDYRAAIDRATAARDHLQAHAGDNLTTAPE